MAINFLNKAKEQANKQRPAGIGAGVPKVGTATGKTNPPTAPKKAGVPPIGGGAKVPPHKATGVPPIPGGAKIPAGVPGGIPGAKKATPPVPPKKETPVDVPVVEEVKEAKEPIAPLASNNPFIKKAAAPKAVEKKEEVPVVEETAKEPEVKEETKETKTAPKKTSKAKATKKEEPKEEAPAEEVVEEKVEEVKEEKKTTKTSKKKATKKEEKVEDVVIPTTEVDFETAIAAIKSPVIDKEWNELKESLVAEINEVSITNDMTGPAVRAVLADLDKMKSKVWLIFSDIRTIYDQLTRKEPENKIERIKRINATGSNAEERKKTGILAAMNFKDNDGKIINLYELLDEVSSRYFFLKDLAVQIQSKESALITYQSTLKSQK